MKIFKWNFCIHDWVFIRHIDGEGRERTGNFFEYKCRKCRKIKQTDKKLHSLGKLIRFDGYY